MNALKFSVIALLLCILLLKRCRLLGEGEKALNCAVQAKGLEGRFGLRSNGYSNSSGNGNSAVVVIVILIRGSHGLGPLNVRLSKTLAERSVGTNGRIASQSSCLWVA